MRTIARPWPNWRQNARTRRAATKVTTASAPRMASTIHQLRNAQERSKAGMSGSRSPGSTPAWRAQTSRALATKKSKIVSATRVPMSVG